MASIGGSADKLVLTTTGTNTTIKVEYTANFTPFDRFLASGGLRFNERIEVLGVDPPSLTTGTILAVFVPQTIPVTPGNTPLSVPRSRTLTVPRSQLDEDPDDDEIRCRISIVPVGLPVTVTALTEAEVLLG
jgi:hypothetical protein